MVNFTKDETITFLNKFAINKKITSTLIDRKVPNQNLYWEGQDKYLNFQIRYLSIPFWLEICLKHSKISISKLLCERNLEIIEEILHYSELEERKKISYDECIEKCSNITEIKSKLNNFPLLHNELKFLIKNYPKYKSLRRGNFLIFFPILISKNKKEFRFLSFKLFDLLTCGCILDDLYDVKEDLRSGEDNLILELGNNKDSVKKAKILYDKSKNSISEYIPNLEDYLDAMFLKSTFKYLNFSSS